MNNEERVRKEVSNAFYKSGILVEKSLLKKINGITVLENLLKNNTVFTNCIFNRKESLQLILKYKRYDLLKYVSIRNVLRTRNRKETFLDYILKEAKNNRNINLSSFDPFDGVTTLKDVAKIYTIYARYGLEDYLPRLNEDLLKQKEKNPLLRILSFNKNLLSLMLSRDREITTNKILSNIKITDLELLLSIKEGSNYKIKLDLQDSYSERYLQEYNESIDSVLPLLDTEDQLLLKKLFELLNDRCDKAVNIVLLSYIEQLYAGDRNSAINEINRLIEIFTNDKNFSIVMGKGTYFSPLANQICLSSSSISSFNHELGHMLFHKLASHSPGDEFKEIINRIKSNPNTINRVESLSNVFYRIYGHIKIKAREYYNDKKVNMENDKEIQSFLDTSKEELIKQYMLKGYSRKTVETILNRKYTLSEYKAQHKEIQISAIQNAICDVKITAITSIADILDAIYKGEYTSNRLINKSGISIKPVSGHGLFYYNNRDDTVFDEIFANYCTIRKVVENDVVLFNDPIRGEIKNPIECLRIMVGDELVNYLESFYQKEILQSEKYTEVRRR